MSGANSGFGGTFFSGRQFQPTSPEVFSVPQQLCPMFTRHSCDPGQAVQLTDYCFSPSGVLPPGIYRVEQLPDVAFHKGIVSLPPRQFTVTIDRDREKIEQPWEMPEPEPWA